MHQVRVVSTLTKLTRLCVLPTFQQEQWWNVRTNVHNIKTKPKRWRYLASRLENAKRAAADAATSEMRRDLVGSGDRSERIRTYNYPQGRMTDHRINLTLYKLDAVMEGDLTELLDSLHREYQADQLGDACTAEWWLMNIAQALALRGEA